MKRSLVLCWFAAALLSVSAAQPPKRNATQAPASAEPGLVEYFRTETEKLSAQCLADIHTLDDWKSRREEYRRQLAEMLGLWPPPEKTELKPVVTGSLQGDGFTVEKLHFQAMPRLYVTANLYLPKGLTTRAPAILYLCGHGRVVTNGVSCGNKTSYQHHGAWFARNGYVCLLIDTVELGEIQGVHRGTHQGNNWVWNSRGYTPAGVEAWFGIRALDYLCSRPEVDPDRIGMTGRSGGGSYTWTVAALDERVKVVAPVAGITDLRNQVVDGAVDGHCDCMFYVNTYRWDFPQVAALLAPRPLLIGNSDKDTIFPLDGVCRLHARVRRIYALYGATNNLGLLITEGPHADTQDLQVPVFRWFNRFLKKEQPMVEMAAKKFFAPEQLRVFERLPDDAVNTKIQEEFVPKCPPLTAEEQVGFLREKVFAGWPAESSAAEPELLKQGRAEGIGWQAHRVESQSGVNLVLWLLSDEKVRKPRSVLLTVLDAETWSNSPAGALSRAACLPSNCANLRSQMQSGKLRLAFFAPRDVVPSPELPGTAKVTQARRRYMLLGQTMDSMRVWDIRRAAQALQAIPECKSLSVSVRAKDSMAVNAAYAALFEPSLARLEFDKMPPTQANGPDYLNVLKAGDLPELLAPVASRMNAETKQALGYH